MGRRDKREVWLKKYARLQGLKALLETHEKMLSPDEEYIKDLHRRIRETRTQLKVMSDITQDDIGHADMTGYD